MLQEMRENDTEADRLEQETIMIERHAAHNREIFYRQTKEVLTQLVDIKQHVEQQVGLIRVMAEKELQDTMAQKLQALEVIQKELENEQKRNSLQIGTNLTELDEQLLESTFDRPLLFSTL
ncbi:hypothetical protein BCR41DRAFT_42526 [Lobosporangium transversale]|uniref:Uncharacterized protein n=1 Tax=Lobosporangium transversale TaxID=64571 RepID=A0A1Y2GQU1_9FUNG|nr:hypothetical protein BCR41DRAFT_42526 [Lobosporangium transversale]ORZ19258.1 hypothetical protein BCR41DRAFT_42526 [Lobosporangium transversale]|eukprot:XP_021882426.1 hypothetical protein BCR41DRAFT_42526 [Lobosporangium transversale]